MAGEREMAGSAMDTDKAMRPRAAERVSSTAGRLFYERGIRAVGVDEIVEQAGVTKPSLYRSFSSKDQLVVTCLRARFDAIMAWWDGIEIQFQGDPLAQLRALIAGIADEAVAEHYRGCAATNAAVEFPEETHTAHLIAQDHKAIMCDRLRQLVARLPVDDPALLADTLALLIEGAQSSRHTSGANGPAGSLIAAGEAVIGVFLKAPAG